MKVNLVEVLLEPLEDPRSVLLHVLHALTPELPHNLGLIALASFIQANLDNKNIRQYDKITALRLCNRCATT